MTERERKHLSRRMTRALRHRPEAVGLKLDKHGWAELGALAAALGASVAEVLEVVENFTDKQRFTLETRESGVFIRAAQGHSIKVDLALASVEPPERLYHGTHVGAVKSIYEQGLSKMGRSHVHLSDTEEKAAGVGRRRGVAVVLVVYARHAHADGVKFYRADNGVWLADHVPARYLEAIHHAG